MASSSLSSSIIARKVVNFFWGTGTIVCLVVVVYAFMTMLSFYSGGAGAGRAFIYWAYMAVGGTGMIGCLVILKLPLTYRFNIALACISTLLGLYLCEALLFFSGRARERGELALYKTAYAARKAGVDFDTRTILEVVLDFEKNGEQVVPHITPSILHKDKSMLRDRKVFPLAGISQSSTVLCNENGQYAMYQSDEYGFNNVPGSFSLPDIDMLLLGDSYTQGYCVKPEENIAGQLQEMTGRKVINLGMAGNGPLLELATLKEYGQYVKPARVLWMFCERNDLGNVQYESEVEWIAKYLEPNFTQGLYQQQSQIDQFLLQYLQKKKEEKRQELAKERRNIVEQFVKLWHLRMMLNIAPSVTPNSGTVPIPGASQAVDDPRQFQLMLLEMVLKQARERIRSWNGELYFVYLPEGTRFVDEKYVAPLDEKREQVLAVIHDLQIPVIDISEAFTAHPDPMALFPFRLNRHYNPEGYQLTAQTIHAYLESR